VNLLGLSFGCVSGLTSPWKFIVTKKRASIKSPIPIDPENDRRHSPRFPWIAEIRGSLLSPLRIAEQVPVSLEAVTENIGTGGVGILTDHPLPRNAVLRCEFAVPGNPSLIPTLMQVRWFGRSEGERARKIGLKFLL
jgi:PilZ domain